MFDCFLKKVYNVPMQKFLTAISILAITTTAAVADFNPFMGNYENQEAFNFGYGIDSGIIVPPPARFVPFFFLHAMYSQPTTFFTLPARQSLNGGQTLGFGTKYGWKWDKYTIPLVFLSEDVALLYGRRWYTSVGAGMGLQAQQNERLGAKLLFQFKLAAGVRITESINIECFMQHFSNANTAHENHSYAFYGIGMAYNF